MNTPLIMTLAGVMLFAHWFAYIMGNPLADPGKVDTKAILFWVPFSLSYRRLKRAGLDKKIIQRHANEIMMASDPVTKRGLQDDQVQEVYLMGRDLFTWEKSLLCPVCFHWWATLIVGVVLITFDLLNARADIFLAAFTYLFTHLLIRKI